MGVCFKTEYKSKIALKARTEVDLSDTIKPFDVV